MNRARVGILVLLSLILLVRERLVPAGMDAGRAAAIDGASRGALRTGSAIDVPDVAGIVTRANPELSPQERNRIATAVLRFSRKYELAPDLVVAVILVESGGRPWVRSTKGAVGLMQVMPQQTARLGFPGNAATIESNVEAGCAILAENIERLGEDRGILAYFWGGDIRGDAYLERVEAARARLRRGLDS